MSELTIVFADLSGFTALTETHGDQDALDIAMRFGALAESALRADARLVKTIGDAVMIVTSEPLVGATLARDLRRRVQAESHFPDLRTGLHAGEVIERDGDYFGAAVNLGARVGDHARPGQVLMTSSVAQAATQLPDCHVRELGAVALKNVAESVVVHALEDASLTQTTVVDPVCRMQLEPDAAPARLPFDGRTRHFCSLECAKKFSDAPNRYVTATLD